MLLRFSANVLSNADGPIRSRKLPSHELLISVHSLNRENSPVISPSPSSVLSASRYSTPGITARTRFSRGGFSRTLAPAPSGTVLSESMLVS